MPTPSPLARKVLLPRAMALLAGVLLLGVLGLHLGLQNTGPATVWRALTSADGDSEALIVRNLRLPRLLLALAVGGALGLSGLLLQTVSRNPVAEPGLLGVNSGAALAVVLLLTFWSGAGMGQMMLAAALGAVLATGLIFGLVRAAGPGLSPIHMLLAGVAVSALLGAGVQVLILLNEAVLEVMLFWLAGAFADRPLTGLPLALPALALAMLGALWLAPVLDVLMTDDATAGTLGVPVVLARGGALAVAAVLAGISVAMAGPVGFAGLVAPHLARLSGAQGHRQLVPMAMLWGMALALAADILARFVLHPSEAPVGAVMAMVGVPLLVVLLRRNRLVLG